jgi:hypothetical protein
LVKARAIVHGSIKHGLMVLKKGKSFRAIHETGHSVLHTVMADNLIEEQALKLEAELISAFGIRKHGGLFTNKVWPNPNNISKRIK